MTNIDVSTLQITPTLDIPANIREVGDNYAALYSPSLSALAANFRRPSPFLPRRRGRRYVFCGFAPKFRPNYRPEVPAELSRRGDGEVGPGGMGGEEGSSGEGSEVLTARERRGRRIYRRDIHAVPLRRENPPRDRGSP